MHPVERLRMVAGAQGDDPGLMAREAAASLAAMAEDPLALVTACRRLVDHQPTCGPLWWLAARVLTAADPEREARMAGHELAEDSTPSLVAALLPSHTPVTVVGWSEQVAEALRLRPDLTVLVVDVEGEGSPLVASLNRNGGEAVLVPEAKLGAAADHSGLVLLEASALGPSGPSERGKLGPSGPSERGKLGPGGAGPGGACALSGSRAAAAVWRDAGQPVWMVAGAGRVLPAPLWEALLQRLPHDEPWDERDEIVPLRLIDQVLGPDGPLPAPEALERADCPAPSELTRPPGPSFRAGGVPD